MFLKKKNKIIFVSTILIVLLLFMVGICVLYGNKITLSYMAESLESEILSKSELELIDIQSDYGKLNGNGNDIQYFVAALVKANSEEDIIAIVGDMQTEYEVVEYYVQQGFDIESKYIENSSLSYDNADINWKENCYYSIFIFDSDMDSSNFFDIKGH